MSVFLPTSAVGNGRVVSTLGGAGEIMTFFYPRLDFAQNIEECMPLLYVGDPGHGRVVWTFDPAFSRNQYYLEDTNILITELQLGDPSVKVTLTDFCPPDSTSLVRLVAVQNNGTTQFDGAFGQYFHFHLSEVPGKQAVGYDPAGGYFLQYFRGIAIAVGGTTPQLWRVGKALGYDERSAKFDLEDGHLNGQSSDIGQVDFAGMRHLRLQPGERVSFWIAICGGSSREDAVDELRRLKTIGPEQLQQQTEVFWRRWLSHRTPISLEPELDAAYRRSLLSLGMLQDLPTGSIIAAPEFDPGYERCGGYGYCWPRDASEAAEAICEAGYPEVLDRLCEWYKTAQLPNGLWGQRHWADGQVAASWALREGFEQLDQTAAALLSICNFVATSDDVHRAQRLKQYWECIENAAHGLNLQVDENGLHRHACDLWETYCGVFLYTNAAFAKAFSAAATCARLAERTTLAEEWQHTSNRLKQACKDLYNGTYFPRGFKENGSLDDAVDTSSLGLVEPWQVLSPHDPEERQMILSNLAEIERRLQQPLDGFIGLRRFEGDVYLGGVVGCVNSLWAAQIYLRLCRAEQGDNPQEARAWRERALELIHLCLGRATSTGLLPELIGLQPDTPYWAVPHAWASALMIRCVLLLEETKALKNQ
ncbi:MAG: glycoside hydrolase family 15 protein [Armatimonadota bacterium]